MKRLFVILFLFISFKTFGQFLNNNWVFGLTAWNNSLINFNNGIGAPAIYSLNSQIDFYVTNASISDVNGSFLFYTNGFNVYDSTNNIMVNGAGLSPDNAPGGPYNDFILQGCLILPVPSHNSLYYLFHETYNIYAQVNFDPQPNILYMSTIDMSQNGGLGAVINKNYHLYEDTITQGRLTACKHANGRDWWLISHEWNNTVFLKWLITPDTILGPYSQSIGSVVYLDGYGQACFSPDGIRYANFYGGYPTKTLDVMKFDRCTGLFDSCQSTSIIDTTSVTVAWGCSFSPNSRFLYLTTSYHVIQFDVWNSNIISTQTIVAYYDNFQDGLNSTFFGPMQIAPDNKIYFVAGPTHYLHYINQPDSGGILCNVVQHNFQMPNQHDLDIPDHPNYSLGKLTGSPCDTLTSINAIKNNDFEFNVFPNPANTVFNISYNLPVNTQARFEIYNAFGEIVSKNVLYGTFKGLAVDVSKLKDGIYFYKISSENRLLKTGKVVVIK